MNGVWRIVDLVLYYFIMITEVGLCIVSRKLKGGVMHNQMTIGECRVLMQSAKFFLEIYDCKKRKEVAGLKNTLLDEGEPICYKV